MKVRFIVRTVVVCVQFVVANSQEQCDVFGALVKKPGKECICDQRGQVRCKPTRLGGRFLVCVLDLSQMGSEITDLMNHIEEKKRTFRDYKREGDCCKKGLPCCKTNKKIDENFDPPDFTMTERPAIAGGIGEDKLDIGNPSESDTFGDYEDDSDLGKDGGDVDDNEAKERKMTRGKLHGPKKSTKWRNVGKTLQMKHKNNTEHAQRNHNDASKHKLMLIKKKLKFKNSKHASHAGIRKPHHPMHIKAGVTT